MAALGPDFSALPEDDEAPALFAEINITPLVDVVLVLLIIFMVGSSAMLDSARHPEGSTNERLELTLPSAGEAKAVPTDAKVLVLSIARDGRVVVRGDTVPGPQLPALLRRLHDEAPSAAVVVDADGGLSHADVVHVLDEIQRAGFASVGIGAQDTGAPGR